MHSFFSTKSRGPAATNSRAWKPLFWESRPGAEKQGLRSAFEAPCLVLSLSLHTIYTIYNGNGARQASSWQAAWARIVISGMVKMESTVLTATVLEARAESRLYCTANSTVLAATGQAA